jgi:hypothetical protein
MDQAPTRQLDRGRPREERKAHALVLFEHVRPPHITLATVDEGGTTAHQTPLAFYWDGRAFTMGLVEPTSKRTANNLRRTGWAHGFVGSTLDVVMVEGPVTFTPVDEVDPAVSDALRARWSAPIDFRQLEGFVFVHLHPQTIQAYWPGGLEGTGRVLMRDGEWVV